MGERAFLKAVPPPRPSTWKTLNILQLIVEQYFILDELFERLTFSKAPHFSVAQQYFGRKQFRIVIRPHHKSVRTGTTHHENVAGPGARHRTRHNESAFFLRENVSRLAQRASNDRIDHWNFSVFRRRFAHRTERHRVVRSVQHRA